MTKEEKLNKLESLKNKANELKKEADYYNALQLAYLPPSLYGLGEKML
jgi:hypothetical protein